MISNSLDPTRDSGDSNHSGIQFPFAIPQEMGVPVRIAQGAWWIRLPIESSLEYVNVYAFRDDQSLTIVDTGVCNAASKQALEKALNHSEFSGLPVKRAIVTHYHPDHIGLAGWLHDQGAELWMSRTCWLSSKLLLQTANDHPSATEVEFMHRAGLEGIELEAFKRQPARRYQSLVSALPHQYVPISDSQQITIGDRVWKVFFGNGHAAEHLTLWSEDLAILGDQVLPGISSNLSLPFTEPDGDLIDEWLLSCNKLLAIADDVTLGLPGHQRPYTGIRFRLQQIISNTHAAIDRMRKLTIRPCSAIEVMEQFYGRKLSFEQRKLMLPEIVGYLNYLCRRGELEKSVYPQGTIAYRRRKDSIVKTTISRPFINAEAERLVATSPETIRTPQSQAAASSNRVAPDRPYRRPHFRMRRMLVLAVITLLLGSAPYLVTVLGLPKLDYATQIQDLIRTATAKDEFLPVEPTPIRVESMSVQGVAQTTVPRIFTGVVKAKRVSEIGFNRIGTISEILVDRGQLCEKDTPLAKLNTHSVEANLKAVAAQRNAAASRLAEMLAGPRQQTIQSARNLVASANAELELAQVSLGRAERLVSIGAVSKQDVDAARTSMKAKRESLSSAQNALDELLEGTRIEQIQAQRAVLKELEAAAEQLQVQMDESILRAPFAGTISEKFLDVGTVCAPGAPAFRLVESVNPEVWVGIPSEYLSFVSQTDSHTFLIQNREYVAKVKAALPELDSATRTKTVVFEMQTAHGGSLLGQVAEIRLQRVLKERGFWLPMTAILKGDNGLAAVFVLEKDANQTAQLSKRELQVLFVDADRAYVSGYLQDGDQIVSNGLHRLTHGQKVRLDTSVDNQETEVSERSLRLNEQQR